MTMGKIITISRQYMSGGRAIGQKLAEKLGIEYYDSKLIELAAKESGFSQEHFIDPEKNASNSFLYSIVRGLQYQDRTTTPWSLEESIFDTQVRVINDLAAKGPCVIIGRCADYILSEVPGVTKVFIYADIKYRVKQAMKNGYSGDEEQCEAEIRKIDKRRQNYYNYHADRKWGTVTNYDLCINSACCSVDSAVKIITEYVGGIDS